jgi:hypothetical protein
MTARNWYGARHRAAASVHPQESELEQFVLEERRGGKSAGIREHLRTCEYCAARVQYIGQNIGPMCPFRPAATHVSLPECLNHPERFAVLAMVMMTLVVIEATPLWRPINRTLGTNTALANLLELNRAAQIAELPLDRAVANEVLTWARPLAFQLDVPRPRPVAAPARILQVALLPPIHRDTGVAVADLRPLAVPNLHIQTPPPADLIRLNEPPVPAPRHHGFLQALSNLWKYPKRLLSARRPYDDAM